MTSHLHTDDLGADTLLCEHDAYSVGIVVGGVGVTGQPVGHAHGGPPRLLKLSKAQKRARPESISVVPGSTRPLRVQRCRWARNINSNCLRLDQCTSFQYSRLSRYANTKKKARYSNT